MPIGTVVTASVLALGLKYLMLGALAGFGWVTCLAASAAAATGILGICWFCTHRPAAYSDEKAITTRLPR